MYHTQTIVGNYSDKYVHLQFVNAIEKT